MGQAIVCGGKKEIPRLRDETSHSTDRDTLRDLQERTTFDNRLVRTFKSRDILMSFDKSVPSSTTQVPSSSIFKSQIMEMKIKVQSSKMNETLTHISDFQPRGILKSSNKLPSLQFVSMPKSEPRKKTVTFDLGYLH